MDRLPVVWTPDLERAAGTHTAAFMAAHRIGTYDDLVRRSIDDADWFWDAVVSYLGIPFSTAYSRVRDDSRGKEWTTWFEGGRINLSEACLDRWAATAPNRLALIAAGEEGGEPRRFSFAQLTDQVGRLAGALQRMGVSSGDAVACFLPMSAEAVSVFLASARLGALFIPIFSGYGPEAVAARLIDPVPAVLVTADAFTRRGKSVAMKEVADAALELAPGVASVLVVSYARRTDTPIASGRDRWWHHIVPESEPLGPEPTDAEHPVLLAYTSGTTGKPKGAVHVHGGLTVKLAEEGAFQLDLHQDDVLMWATDMGWIMGPWMVVAGLANGAAIAIYDGAPDWPGPDRLWSLVGELGLTALGLSPTLVRALKTHGDEPAGRHDLSLLRAFGSTGEPWNPDPWWWLFETVGGGKIPIVNISGGTEIGACILSVNLMQGIKPTSLGGPALGMAADVFDPDGRPLRGEVGELVVKEAWPGMTRGFWKDPARYLDSYWRRFPGVWVHGDWASIDEDGFWYLHGRSDDTLNIAGKRIGPAELESAALTHPAVVAAAAIGVPDRVKGEAPVVYAVAAAGVEPSDGLASEVAQAVASALGKAFRPKAVIFVADLPRTRSAKIMRRVVRALALGREPGDLSSLENPESLKSITALRHHPSAREKSGFR